MVQPSSPGFSWPTNSILPPSNESEMETDASAAAVDDLKRNEDLKECVEKALEEREQKIKATRECLILLLLNVFRFIIQCSIQKRCRDRDLVQVRSIRDRGVRD